MEDSSQPGPSQIVGKIDFENMPGPAAEKIFDHLEYEELVGLGEACQTTQVQSLVQYGKVLLSAKIKKCSNFIWKRYIEQNEENMAPRMSHSMVYHGGVMYIFGGRAVNDPSRTFRSDWACFNDLFKFDMQTKKMSRIQVTTTPYPLPKSGASMNIYKDQILLFGGRKPLPNTFGLGIPRVVAEPNTNEIHLFDTKDSYWKKMATINEGPTLYGHSAVISNDLLITFGGQLGSFTLNTTFRVLDLKKSRWFTPRLPGVQAEFNVNRAERIATEFPIYGANSTSLILLKDGHLLLIGECRPPGRRNAAVLVVFDEENPEEKSWEWRSIPTTGKWWDQSVTLVGPSKHRNSDFNKVVPLYGDGFVRLVTVGLPSSHFKKMKPSIDGLFELGLNPDDADVFIAWKCGLPAALAHYCIKKIQERFNKKIQKIYPHGADEKDDEPMSFVFNRGGVHIVIPNLLLFKENPSKPTKKRIRVWLDREGEKYRGEIDCVWLEKILHITLRHFTDRLFQECEYEKNLNTKSGPSRVDNNNMKPKFSRKPFTDPLPIWKSTSQLVSYSALIPLGPNWKPSDLQEIRYEEGDHHFNCPPPYHNFALCAGPAEVVLHGGDFDLANKYNPATYMLICSPRHHL